MNYQYSWYGREEEQIGSVEKKKNNKKQKTVLSEKHVGYVAIRVTKHDLGRMVHKLAINSKLLYHDEVKFRNQSSWVSVVNLWSYIRLNELLIWGNKVGQRDYKNNNTEKEGKN